MPYIPQSSREMFDDALDALHPVTPGELNYCVTKLCDQALGKMPGYTEYNTIIGVLESAKLEFYRRCIAPYENQKLAENGDVFDADQQG